MNAYQTKKNAGFTIIEVVLVLAIVGLIFLIVFLAVPALQKGTRDTQRRQDMSRMMSQIANFQANNNGNVPPANSTALSDFMTRYLTAGGTEKFSDPLTGTDYTLQAGTGGTIPANIAFGTVYYYVGYKCNGEALAAVSGGSNRSVAVVTPLERGGLYCQNN